MDYGGREGGWYLFRPTCSAISVRSVLRCFCSQALALAIVRNGMSWVAEAMRLL